MNTWTCKAASCVLLSVSLAGCDTIPMPALSFAPALTGQSQHAGRVYRSAEMLNGKFLLLPPDGYCIEGNSLTQTFALMADCQVLVGEGAENLDEPDVLTASFATTIEVGRPSVETVTDALAPLAVKNAYAEDDVAYVEVTDPNVPEALDPVHWRGIVQHRGTVIGFASYAAKGLDTSPRLIKQATLKFAENNSEEVGDQSAHRSIKSNLMSIVGLFR